MNQTNSQNKSTFAAAFLFLSKEKRKALKTVYAFCSTVDDAVDIASDNALAKLGNWKQEIEFLYAKTPKTLIGKNLLRYIDKFNLKKEHFMLIVEGVAQDLTVKRYKTFKDLEFYLYRVASAVGFLCINIFGYKNPKTIEYAKYTGYALQLTNIIRDVAEDVKMGRIYLPLEDLKKFNLSETDIINCKMSKEIKNLLAFQAERAKTYYALAKKILPKEDYSKMLPARIMGSLYRSILDKIEKKGFEVFSKKIKLTKFEKIKAVISAF
ncbi:MAG TPA: squalene/phytoene synthase family protein [Elusimicrobiales bacterium]|nr:squalene/phytoene synthase family protein [Elusimicrobiales bacterium]